jgi:hypothetical protein
LPPPFLFLYLGMEKIIKEFWIKNEWLLERYEEDYGLNGRDYILSVDDIEELEEILENYL